jgi:pimeloyl-ACP methyl ester carboxylesterase
MPAEVQTSKPRPQPLFFNSNGRPLYGLYCAPANPRADAPVLIGCHSVAIEHNATCRMLALLTREAAAAGFPALVYHSRGHGDSAGDVADVSFETLVEDALSAADEACRRSGATRVIWLGVRFGCLVAAEAARRRPGAAALALWEPLHRGADYFRQLARGILFAAVARGEKPNKTADDLLNEVDREGRVQVYGSYLYHKFYDSGRRVELAKSLEHWSGPTQLAQIQPRLTLAPTNAALAASLEARGAKVHVTRIGDEPGWQISGLPWLSPPLLTETGAWLHALA